MAGRRLGRKISTKTVTGFGPAQIREILAEKTGPVDLYTVVGVARGFREGSSDYGDWIGLTGEFETVNQLTGEVTNAGRCFLPGHVVDLVKPALNARDDAAIEFAFMIGVAKADNNFGYEYTCDKFVAPGETDRLSGLRGLIPSDVKQVAQIEDKSAEKPAAQPAEASKK